MLTINIPTAAKAADQILLLDLHLNGNPTGKIGEFTLRGNTLLSQRGELHDLGFQVPASSDSDGLVALSTLPGLTWHLDQKTMTLYVKVSDNQLLPTVLHLDESDRPATPRTIESGTGVTLNYDIVGILAGNHNGTSGSLDFRAFSPKGVLSSGLLVHAGAAPVGTGTNPAIRLDSTYQFADVHTLRRYSVGDFITGSLAWTRPIRLAGAQIRSDFSMRPDLVTFPLPSISGSAAVHSVVDVLTNGGLVLSRQVDPGPFEIPELPMVTGAGTISMTVTNALGQQTSVTQPFYASSALLAPGLHTFSAQVGAVRRNWGIASNDYGKFAGIANYRRGLSSKITIEGSAEATPGTIMAGGGGVLNVCNLAVVNFAAAGSIGSEGTGAQLSAGGQHIGRRFSLGGSVTIAGRQFQDVAAMNGDPVPRQQLNANTGVSLKAFGSVGIAYAGLDVQSSANSVDLSVMPIQRSHVLSASYSVQVHHMSIYANEFHDFTSTGSNGVMVGLTIPFGRRGSVSVSSGSEGGYGQVQVQQSVASIGDWGYQTYVSAADPLHEFAQVQYKSRRGLLLVGADRTGGATSVNLESQGALSFVDGGLFPSNSIYDSFAIVDTGPMPHVHVLQENRDVGRTNSTGRLLVPDMHSFDLNHIAIVPTDIPPDATVDITSREVRPQDRSGVVIKFPMRISHGALLRLVNEAGVPVPVGSTARLLPAGVVVPVGYDGDAYVEDLNSHNEIEVERPNGQRCSVAFEYQPVLDEIPIIGPLLCREQGR
ncbi:fimbria/pilus outer membrane usher protein [Edaphobacter paludis]|uniref:Fimbria/pilus outer membrane usher protein n=1 Tax=Edaphobacter paludis TaxID=3035702 RepID=A0AAU7DAL1_9BACT